MTEFNTGRVLMAKPPVGLIGCVFCLVIMVTLMVVGGRCLPVGAMFLMVVMVRQQVMTQRKSVGQPEQRNNEGTNWHLLVNVGNFRLLLGVYHHWFL